jgi:NAD(P)-dependent dehydrogenase (short-subunit alcohol dehydrogenase family)
METDLGPTVVTGSDTGVVTELVRIVPYGRPAVTVSPEQSADARAVPVYSTADGWARAAREVEQRWGPPRAVVVAPAPVARGPEKARKTAERVNAEGGKAVAVPGDVASPAEVESFVAETESSLGPVDILVNNAAIVKQRYADETLVRRIATADEIAGLIAWLASDRANAFSGQTVAVTGGRSE